MIGNDELIRPADSPSTMCFDNVLIKLIALGLIRLFYKRRDINYDPAAAGCGVHLGTPDTSRNIKTRSRVSVAPASRETSRSEGESFA